MSVDFDAGNTTFLDCGSLLPDASFSVCLWMRATSVAQIYHVAFGVRRTGNVNIGLHNGVFFLYPATGNGADGSTSPGTGLWFHGAYTHDDTTDADGLKGYYNGVEEVSTASASATAINITRIGRDDSTTRDWHGQLGAVKVWTGVVLTPQEIADEMRQHVPVHHLGNLHAWTPFIHPTGGTVFTDFSAAGNDWTESGAVADSALNPPIPWRRQRDIFVRRFAVPSPAAGVIRLINGNLTKNKLINGGLVN